MSGITISPSARKDWSEVKQANQEAFEHFTLHDFKVLVDQIGPAEVLKRMDGDTFWKLYSYFKTTAQDGG